MFNRGAARLEIFRSDADRVEFGRLLGVAHERFGFRVHAYCLMGNHYHLVVECPDGGLSEAMHLIGSVYVRHSNERAERDGPLFRERFRSKPVVDEHYLRCLVRYVHRNPLAFLELDELVHYRWSSLRTYLGYRRKPPWLVTDEILAVFGGLEGFETAMFSARTGTDGGASVDAIFAGIDLMVHEHLGDGAVQRVGRTVALLLLDRFDPATAEAVRRRLDYGSAGALNSARFRSRRRAEIDPRLAATARAVEEFLT